MAGKVAHVTEVTHEDTRTVEEFFTQELSRKLGRSIPVAVMHMDFAEIDIPDPPYHKSVSRKIVEEYSRDFNPVVAGFLVLNIRETGKVALVDGRHRREMALKNGYRGWWFVATEGLTVAEEAVLFQYFQARKPMKTAEKMRALIVSGDPAALRLRAAVVSSGCAMAFEDDRNRHPITAVEALQWIFQRGGEVAIKRVLKLAVNAWMGQPVSLTNPMLKALWVFLSNDEVKRKLDHDLLETVLKSLVPDQIIKRGRLTATEERCATYFGVAQILRHEYNKAVKGGRGAKNHSRVDYDFTHPTKLGDRGGDQNQGARYRSDVRKDMPVVPAHLQGEIESRRQFGGRAPISAGLLAAIKQAIEEGFMAKNVMAAFEVSQWAVTLAGRSGDDAKAVEKFRKERNAANKASRALLKKTGIKRNTKKWIAAPGRLKVKADLPSQTHSVHNDSTD